MSIVTTHGRRALALASYALLGYVIFELAQEPVPTDEFRRVRFNTVVALLIAQTSAEVTPPLSWYLLHRVLSPVTLRQSYQVIMPTIYLNYFPIKGSIFAARLLAARSIGVKTEFAVPSLFILFVWRWLFVALLVPLLFFIDPLIVDQNTIVAVGVGVFLLCIAGALAVVVTKTDTRRKLAGLLASRERFRSLGVQTAQLPARLLSITTSRGMIYHNLILISVNLLAAWALSLVLLDFGYDVNIASLFLILLVSMAIGFISLLPGGIGAQEASFAYLLTFLDVPIEIGVSVGLLWRFIVTSFDLAFSGTAMIFFRRYPSKIDSTVQ